MTKLLWIATCLLLAQAVHSYILLTANIEDVKNVAKRLVQLPISGQVGSIVRRAYDVFDEAYNRISNTRGTKHHVMRTGEKDDKDYSDSNRSPAEYGDMDFRRTNEKWISSQIRPDEKQSQPKNGTTSGNEEWKEGQDKPEEKREDQNKGNAEPNEVVADPSEGRVEPKEERSEPEKAQSEPNEGRGAQEKGRDEPNARRGDPEEFSALGKSASVYLKKIKKIFDNA